MQMPSRSQLARSLACTLAGAVAGILPATPAHAAEGRILIVKTDQFAEPVAGAVFEAFLSDGDGSFEPDEVDGDAKAAECTSENDGECNLGPLADGDYFVRELSAPAGYLGDTGVRGPIPVVEDDVVVIDRATDLDGDGQSDGFLNVRDIIVGSLVVSVEGGDPTFELDPPVLGPFILGEGESATFTNLPQGEYTLTVTDLEDGTVLDAIDCGDAEIASDLPGQSVTFEISPEETVECTFTVSEIEDDDYDGYDDDPGDPDFDFEPPFVEAGDPDTPPPAADPGAGAAGVNTPPTGDPGLIVSGATGTPATPGSDTIPGTYAELPRTGVAVAATSALGAALVALGGLATWAGARRRRARTGL
ncbi:MAG: prealbumin-like fold domain-containing protein [Acidimicrobiia bacterium]